MDPGGSAGPAVATLSPVTGAGAVVGAMVKKEVKVEAPALINEALKSQVLAKGSALLENIQALHRERKRELYFLKHGGALSDFAKVADAATMEPDLRKFLDEPIINIANGSNRAISTATVGTTFDSTPLAKELKRFGTSGLKVEVHPGSPTLEPSSEKANGLNGAGPMSATSPRPSDETYSDYSQDPMSKREAQVVARIKELKVQGLWSQQRLPKLAEPSRHKMHWDYLLEEMEWLSNDFQMEKKWKKALAKKVARAAQKWHEDKLNKEARELKQELARKKKVAANIARESTKFWKQMLHVVQYKEKLELEAVKKVALEQHLDFIVTQTARYTKELRENMNPDANLTGELVGNAAKTQTVPSTHESATSAGGATAQEGETEQEKKDKDFNPEVVEAVVDDESSMAQADEPKDAEKELDSLANDAELSIDELMAKYYSQEAAEQADEEDDGDEADEAGEASTAPATPTRSSKRRKTSTSETSDTEPTTGRRSTRSRRSASASKQESDAEETKDTADEADADNETTGDADGPSVVEAVEKKVAKAEKLAPDGPAMMENPDVKTKVPFLLKATLRPYQQVGLDWLANMCARKLNGILADEMGLGKTIQTISLLAHLAVEKGNWGPHLIVVPTSVMLNWEVEFKKFCPAFKILTYYGSIAQRREKRKGWSNPDTFHVCITSYKLAVQDNQILKRKKWKYLILDEAHQIKNFESKRWQALLGMSSRRRLLLTGTPLQNNLMELWSLLHFLMPRIFESHQQFKELFGSPIGDMVEGLKATTEQQKAREQERVSRLHMVLRPFLLRRLKADVEKQLPAKYEHVVECHLSKRQRYLYDDFMSRGSTRNSLKGGNYVTIVNVLMQLRKVCNHPNLFAEPEIRAPFVMADQPIAYRAPALVKRAIEEDPLSGIWSTELSTPDTLSLCFMNLCLLHNEIKSETGGLYNADTYNLIRSLPTPVGGEQLEGSYVAAVMKENSSAVHPIVTDILARKDFAQKAVLERHATINAARCSATVMYGKQLRRAVSVVSTLDYKHFTSTFGVEDLVLDYAHRLASVSEICTRFTCLTPKVLASVPVAYFGGKSPPIGVRHQARDNAIQNAILDRVVVPASESTWSPVELAVQKQAQCLTHASLDVPRQIFPDRRLIQYDCGKLQVLEHLLREKQIGGHRVLIFTQMSKMLDVLEQFLTYHGLTYVRLDGSTGIEKRQRLMDRFNNDSRIFCFILSTRSGGVGVNLTGADTVVFYDNDWNPTMDAQAQDRCHRIGQTREVNIYRMVTKKTIEENILKKAQQKRELANLAVESGEFTTDFFSVTDFFDDVDVEVDAEIKNKGTDVNQADMEAAMLNAEDESDRVAAKRAAQEHATEMQEFDESKPFPDDIKYNSSTSESEAAPTEDEHQADLKSQLAGLRGVEKHALGVLERYLEPIHQRKLEQARQALEEKESQLREMETRIQDQEAAMSEDDDEVFFDPTEAYEAYTNESLKHIETFKPPDPFGQEEVYVEPSHAMQYRVGYMLFKPLPAQDERETARRRHRKRIRKAYEINSENLGVVKRRRRYVDMPRRYAIRSLFRKFEDVRNRNSSKHKHPKRPVKYIQGRDRREVDSNKDAPPWVITEDYHLLKIVRNYLSQHNGTVNWYLVADAFNTATSLTGRYRSKVQCRDRYFRVIMPREEGKYEEIDDSDEKPQKKRKKDLEKDKSEKSAFDKKSTKQKPPMSTDRMYEVDKSKSLYSFHATMFASVTKAVQQTRKPVKPKRETPHASQDQILNSILNQNGPSGQKGPFTPTQLSDRRLQNEREKKAAQATGSGFSKTKQQPRTGATKYASSPSGQSVGTPNVPPTKQVPTAERLAAYAIQQFKSVEAQRAVLQIYRNPALPEETKAKQLTQLIQSYKQQLAVMNQRQQGGAVQAPFTAQSPRGMAIAQPVQAHAQQFAMRATGATPTQGFGVQQAVGQSPTVFPGTSVLSPGQQFPVGGTSQTGQSPNRAGHSYNTKSGSK